MAYQNCRGLRPCRGGGDFCGPAEQVKADEEDGHGLSKLRSSNSCRTAVCTCAVQVGPLTDLMDSILSQLMAIRGIEPGINLWKGLFSSHVPLLSFAVMNQNMESIITAKYFSNVIAFISSPF